GDERRRAPGLRVALRWPPRGPSGGALRLAHGAQLLVRDGLPELLVRLRPVAGPARRDRSTAAAPHLGARPRHGGAVGRALVHAPVPARRRRRAGRAARRHTPDVAGEAPSRGRTPG